MKRWGKIGVLIFVVALSISTIVAATYTETASFSGTTKAFSPNSGTLTVTYNPSTVRTVLSFTYSEARATQIFANSYNSDYAGVDVKEDYNRTLSDVMNAYSVVTSLPNAKTDIETNAGQYADEVEAIPFGMLEGGVTYTMTALWNDMRSSGAANSQEGRFCANSEESAPGLNDYNVIPGHYESLTQVYFGNVKGNP